MNDNFNKVFKTKSKEEILEIPSHEREKMFLDYLGYYIENVLSSDELKNITSSLNASQFEVFSYSIINIIFPEEYLALVEVEFTLSGVLNNESHPITLIDGTVNIYIGHQGDVDFRDITCEVIIEEEDLRSAGHVKNSSSSSEDEEESSSASRSTSSSNSEDEEESSSASSAPSLFSGSTSLPNQKSQTVEFLSSWSRKSLNIICGFANADGGEIYIGVDDHGSILGIENPDIYMTEIIDSVQKEMNLLVQVKILNEKKPILRITVQPSTEYVTLKDRIYVRQGTSTVKSTREKIEINEKENSKQEKKKPKPNKTKPQTSSVSEFAVDVQAVRNFQRKKILVIGASKYEKGAIELFIAQLAKELSDNEFSIINGGWTGLDSALSAAFVSHRELKNPLELIHIVDEALPANQRRTDFGGSIIEVGEEESYHLPLSLADAVIMVGGGNGTYKFYEELFNSSRKIPILSLAQYGEASKKAFESITSKWNKSRKEFFEDKLNFFDYAFLGDNCHTELQVNLQAEYCVTLLNILLDHKSSPIDLSRFNLSSSVAPILKRVKTDELQFTPFGIFKAYNMLVNEKLNKDKELKEKNQNIRDKISKMSGVENINNPSSFSLACDLIILQATFIALNEVENESFLISFRHYILALNSWILSTIEISDDLRKEFIPFIKDCTSGKENLKVFLRRIVRESDYSNDTITEFISDCPAEKDALNVRADAKGMARLIMHKDMKHSLALGIFGSWGSGKSSFFRFLRKEIDIISSGKDITQEEYKNFYSKDVCHIPFNAWHYHDSNLWASILVHIYDHLARYYAIKKSGEGWEEKLNDLTEGKFVDLKAEEIEKISLSLQSSLLVNKVSLKKVKDEINSKNLIIESLEKDIETKQKEVSKPLSIESFKEIAKSYFESNEEVQQICKELKVERSLESLKAAEKEIIESTKNISTAYIKLWEMLKKNKIKCVFYLLYSAIIFLTLNVTISYFTVNFDLLKGKFENLLSALGTLLATHQLWVSKLKSFAIKISQTISNAKDSIEQLKEERVKEYNEDKGSAEQELRILEQEHQSLIKEKAKLEKSKSALSPNRHIYQFIDDRIQSEKFKSSLGFISEVRHEFENLERLVSRARNQGKSNAETKKSSEQVDNLPKLDRIILYIDDLDRCEHKTVLEVLQAVHLILGFELFVVVVGVDTRWLFDALDNFGAINTEKDISPEEYLEKLIQIPYCLPTVSENLVEGLIGLQFPSDLNPNLKLNLINNKVTELQKKLKDQINGNVSSKAKNNVNENLDQENTVINENTSSIEFHKRYEMQQIDEKLKTVSLTEGEIYYLKSLAFPGITPRVYKRMLNVYKILRTSLSIKVGITAFFDNEQFKIVWFLMCIQASYKDEFDNIFSHILNFELGPGSSDRSFYSWIVKTTLEDKKDNRYFELGDLAKQKCTNNCSPENLKTFIFSISQYSFDTVKYSNIVSFSERLEMSNRIKYKEPLGVK